MEKQGTGYPLIYSTERWKGVKEDLEQIAGGKLGLPQVVAILRKFNKITNGKERKQRFQRLGDAKLERFKGVLGLLSAVAEYILKHEASPIRIPIAVPHISKSYRLVKREIVLLMCLMTMCLTLKTMHDEDEHLKNFSVILDDEAEKAQSVLSYLDITLGGEFDPEQPFVIKRNCQVSSLDAYGLMENTTKLGELEMLSNQASIEDFNGKIKVDFANEYLGGGALTYGCVQEEIMFICHPQLYTAMLLCPRMNDNEAIGLVGYRKYFKVRGYASTTEFDGIDTSTYKETEDGVLEQYIVAIDATYKRELQFTEQTLIREIKKAYAGFTCFPISDVVSGNWGCGAFGGNLHAKLLIQWIAATLSNKKLLYCPFSKLQTLQPVYRSAMKMTIGQVFGVLHSYEQESKGQDRKSFTFLKHFMKQIGKECKE